MVCTDHCFDWGGKKETERVKLCTHVFIILHKLMIVLVILVKKTVLIPIVY